MKEEEIKDPDFAVLEKIAEDESIKAPSGLQDKVEKTLLAEALLKGEHFKQKQLKGWPQGAVGRRWIARIGLSAVALAAGIALIFTLGRPVPKDTFDDPRLAYAEVEKTFSRISQKMDVGVKIAREAEEKAEDAPRRIIDNINN